MTNKKLDNLVIENAQIRFRNFSGNPDKFNTRGGVRQFAVLIPHDIAADLMNEGWNIKFLKARNEDEEDQPYLSVKVNYSGNVHPNIYLVTKKNKTVLNEDTVGSLDYAEIANIDITIRPYQWEVNGKTGVAAYVKTMYVTVVEDEFASKYDFDDEVPFN